MQGGNSQNKIKFVKGVRAVLTSNFTPFLYLYRQGHGVLIFSIGILVLEASFNLSHLKNELYLLSDDGPSLSRNRDD